MAEPRILICGSIAFDTIMVFNDRFRNHILPDKVHLLNVSFVVFDMRREFGGCAGNIGYNLRMLGGEPVLMATTGADDGPYRERLSALGLDATHVRTMPGTYTAQAFITTDLDDNQITAFHPGAMALSNAIDVREAHAARSIDLGIVAPDGRDGMIAHARQMKELGIPFVFDPGQAMPLFERAELAAFVRDARYIAVNDYECEMLQERAGMSVDALAREVDAMIITRGAEGSDIIANGETLRVPIVPAEVEADPTGCGDAYRAGLLYGIAHGWNWRKTGRLASLLGSIKIAERGGQNHAFDRQSLEARYRAAFAEPLW